MPPHSQATVAALHSRKTMTRLLAMLAAALLPATAVAHPSVGTLHELNAAGSARSSCTVSLFRAYHRTLALTAAHCLEVEEFPLIGRHYATHEYATEFGGRRYPVRPLRVGDGVDVALLEFTRDVPDGEPFELADWDTVELGERLVSWGNLGGLGVQRLEGYVTRLALTDERFEQYLGHALLSMPVSRGSSGSAVLTADGRIAGVVATILQPASNRGSPITVMVPSSFIADFLEDDELANITAY